ncbi:MAG TPA: hypothetical protein VG936_16770 [Lacunisphaera sp.]|nr:hypothetical protein [Lacunisphaera sp.]
MIPTIQYAHRDIWTQTPAARGPTAMTVDQVVRGQEVQILVFATNCTVGADGAAEVTYDISFVRPDGKTGGSKTGLRLIPRGPVKNSRYVRKAVDMVGFVANGEDPLGEWKVVVAATDRIGSLTVQREQTFKVVDYGVLDAPVPGHADPGRWLMNYHNRPAPHQLLAMLQQFAENPPVGTPPPVDEENGALLGFFEQVLKDNPWLLPHVIARLAKTQDRERALLSVLLAYAKRDDPAFADSLPDALRDSIKTHRLERWPAPTAEPLRGAQLDVLWGRFFASGRYEPIRALVGVLAYHPFKEALSEYKLRSNKPAPPPVEVLKSAVFGAAVWSLRSNIQQDQLVRDYCEAILLRRELPEAEHAWLAGIYRMAMEKTSSPQGQAGP